MVQKDEEGDRKGGKNIREWCERKTRRKAGKEERHGKKEKRNIGDREELEEERWVDKEEGRREKR